MITLYLLHEISETGYFWGFLVENLGLLLFVHSSACELYILNTYLYFAYKKLKMRPSTC